jgi:hypothetical protein
MIVIGLGAQISFDGFIEKRKKKKEGGKAVELWL